MKKQVLAVVGVLALAGLAFAQAPPQDRPGRPDQATRPRMRTGGPARMGEALGLTDQQKAQVEKLQTDLRRAAIKRNADLRLARLELGELLKAQTVDEKAVAQRVKELTDLEGAAIKARVDHLLGMKKILTPEQWEKAKQLHAGRGWGAPGQGTGRRMMRGPHPGQPGPGADEENLDDDAPNAGGLGG